MKKQVINSLTALRGLACLAVIISHQKHVDPTWQTAGGMGVDFFFALSGYLLILRAADTILDGKTSWTFLRAYFTRRVFRIYPPYIIALIVFAFCYNMGWKYIWQFPVHITDIFGTGSGHLWTVKVELYFYFIMFPIVFCLLSFMAHKDIKKQSRYHIHLIFGIIILLMVGVGINLAYTFWGIPRLFQRYWVFLFGCIGGIATGIRRKYYSHINASSLYIRYICTVVSWVLMIRIFFTSNYNASLYLNIPWNSWIQGEVTASITFSLLMVLLEFAEDDIWLGKALNAVIFIDLGDSSYSTYLIHRLVVGYIPAKTKLEGSDAMWMSIIFSILFGQVLFVVEKNSVKYGNKLIKKWQWDKKSSQIKMPENHLTNDSKVLEVQELAKESK